MTSGAEFGVDAVQADGEVVLIVRGEIDLATAPQLMAAASAVDEPGTMLVFDLASMTFMDSSGLSVLANTAIRLRRSGGSVYLRDASMQVRRIVKLAGLDAILTIDDAQTEAPE